MWWKLCLKLRFCSEWELKNPSFSTFLLRRHVNEVSKLKPFKPVIDMVISQYLFRIYMFIFQDVPTLELFNFISFINESYTSLLHYDQGLEGVWRCRCPLWWLQRMPIFTVYQIHLLHHNIWGNQSAFNSKLQI